MIETNPDALAIAEALDRERAERGPRGPLHGIPILLKDNIDTADQMQTTAGSLALVGVRVEQDATIVRRLRDAGAVILGKTNLSEWANFRSTRSSSGWSGRGRQTRQSVRARSQSGWLELWLARGCREPGSVGDRDGDRRFDHEPSSNNGLAGLPTVGLASRAGIIPISHTQERSPGPRAQRRRRRARAECHRGWQRPARPSPHLGAAAQDYTTALDRAGLKGARIGVARKFNTGYSEHTDAVFEQAVDRLRAAGAEVVDDVEIPGHQALRKPWSEGEEITGEGLVLQYEFKADLAVYLATRPDAPIKSIDDLIRFNEEHAAEEMPYFRQERLVSCAEKGPLTDQRYQDVLRHNQEFGRGFVAFLDECRFDALVAPTNAPPWVIDTIDGDRHLGGSSMVPAITGFPLITARWLRL